jgi:AcrR family transcriptional regulator
MNLIIKDFAQAAEPTGKRGQVLRELRRQIGVRGIDGITMRDLAKESGVALKTLYNLFGSKEALVAESVRETYRSVMGSITQGHECLDAFDQLIAYARASAQFNLAEPVYTKAMIYAYYAQYSSECSFHADFHDYIGGGFEELLVKMQILGELRPWSSPKVIARQIVESLISTAAEWIKQVVPDDAFVDSSLLSVFSLLYVHLNDRRRDEAEARIREIGARLEPDRDPARRQLKLVGL